MNFKNRCDLTQELFLPTLLFTALGGMTWAVRGCSGFGASPGCIFAGVMWGAAWWYLAHEPKGEQTRRYSSAWIVLAVTLGIGFSGNRGWMQWPSFFEGRLDTNVSKHESVPISQFYGFLWLFIAGVPWAGIGACALAWCGSLKETRVWHWVVRIGCGLGVAYLARYLYDAHPDWFLPMYSEFEDRYKDFDANPNLRRLSNDCGAAIFHLGYYLGFLLFEIIRRDWKNVVLIATVGVLNGAGWAAFQNWKWANQIWGSSAFNFWRCWESSGGLSIGFALGIAYFLVNRPMSDKQLATVAARQAVSGPNFEWFLIFCGLTAYLSPFLRSQTAGWSSYYLSVLYLFAAAYYLAYRKPANTEEQGNVNIECAAVFLSLAFIAGNFLQYILPHVLPYILPDSWKPEGRRETMRFMMRIGLYYNGAVFAAGLAWYLLFRSRFGAEKAAGTPTGGDPNLERLGLYLGLLTGVGLSIRNGAKGWFNIYLGNENYWSGVLWKICGPTFLVCLLALTAWILFRPRRFNSSEAVFPHAYAAMWLVLIVQNIIAQLITGPLTQWFEVAFSIYYLLLFLITAVITIDFRVRKEFAMRRIHWSDCG